MYKGGYQIIDISGINFTLNNPEVVKGVYEKVSRTTKPIMISDFKVDGKHERASFVQAYHAELGSNYELKVDNSTSRYLIKISKSDNVTIENV